MALETKKREIAYKVWIKDLHGGEFVKQEGWDPNYVELKGRQISRAHIIGTVVSKFSSEDGNYAAITIDDGTETMRCKTFGPEVALLKNASIGKVLRIIGKVKEYNEERYIAPEAAHEIKDMNWIILHKLELGDPITGVLNPDDVQPSMSEDVAEELISESDSDLRTKIVEKIKELDDGKGADTEQLFEALDLEKEEAQNLIIGLLKSGDAYEPKNGKIKLLE